MQWHAGRRLELTKGPTTTHRPTWIEMGLLFAAAAVRGRPCLSAANPQKSLSLSLSHTHTLTQTQPPFYPSTRTAGQAQGTMPASIRALALLFLACLAAAVWGQKVRVSRSVDVRAQMCVV
jgi:hypothetical protein